MTKEEILKLRDSAEQTRVQFKERVTGDNKYDVCCEMTALSNSHGGMAVVGINDKTGDINPLSYVEVLETTNLLASLASEGVVPQILIETETVAVEDILKGTSMPRNEFLFTNANYLLPYTGAGTGIIRAMEEKPEVTFENQESAHEFVVTFKRQSSHGNNQETHQEKHQEESSEVRLTKDQLDIVNFCSIPRSAKEILDRKGLYNQSRARKKYIQPLLDMGVLEMTIPENPNDRNQKYRKVRRG